MTWRPKILGSSPKLPPDHFRPAPSILVRRPRRPRAPSTMKPPVRSRTSSAVVQQAADAARAQFKAPARVTEAPANTKRSFEVTEPLASDSADAAPPAPVAPTPSEVLATAELAGACARLCARALDAAGELLSNSPAFVVRLRRRTYTRAYLRSGCRCCGAGFRLDAAGRRGA